MLCFVNINTVSYLLFIIFIIYLPSFYDKNSVFSPIIWFPIILTIFPLPFFAKSYALSTGIVLMAFKKCPIIGLFTLLAAPIKWISLLLLATITVPSTN